MVIFLFCNLQRLQALPINYMENIQGADENITTSPILQISSNGNKKPRRNAEVIYASRGDFF